MSFRPIAVLLSAALAAAPVVASAPAAASSVIGVTAFSKGTPGLLSGVTLAPGNQIYGTLVNGGDNALGAVYNISKAKLNIIYSFTGGAGGDSPNGSVLIDQNGNLFGTTEGGNSGLGTVWELSPPVAPATAWTLTTLHVFTGPDGANPLSGLTFSKTGKLYGTTVNGGASFVDSIGNPGLGTIYELTPPVAPSTDWGFRVVYSFTGGMDGAEPAGPIIIGGVGTLFGTALAGGRGNNGTVFKVATNKRGVPSFFATIYAFKGTSGLDGSGPFAGLTLSRDGNLLGTTEFGGLASDSGTVFQLTPVANGYQETVLHRFTGGSDGGNPIAPVYGSASGTVYGVASRGGAQGTGAFFALTPPPAGTMKWGSSAPVSFVAGSTAGYLPVAPLTPSSNSFLTVTAAGARSGDGALVRIVP